MHDTTTLHQVMGLGTSDLQFEIFLVNFI